MATNQDLFSLLPDSLLITIVSLLPLKDAVRTSVLAKGWCNLWRFQTDIEINERNFCSLHNTNQHQNNISEMQNVTQLEQISCIKFGYSWLGSQESLSSISSFSLTFSNPRDYRVHMDRFISFALSRQTKSLELDFSCLSWEDKFPISDRLTYRERFDLPEFVYKYGSSLESLKLVSCSFRDNNLINLSHALKTVSLEWIGFTSMLHLKNFVDNCPLLKSLSLFKCFNSTNYVIVSNSLETLMVHKCVDLLNLTVFAPKLSCFKYCGELVQFGLINFPSMEIVDLDFGLASMIDEEQGDKIASLLQIFHNASFLTVCAYTTQVLPLALDGLSFPRSPCTRNLTIRTSFYESEFSGILLLLDSYPSLEKLQFEFGQQTNFKEDLAMCFGRYPPEKLKPSIRGCLTKKLKYVKIKGFRGSANEFKILFFLIRYGCVLQNLVLKVAKNDHTAETAAMGLKETLRQQHPNALKVEVLS